MKSNLKALKKSKRFLLQVIDNLRSFIRKRNYLGYTLFYSKGTSLIDMIDKNSSLYDPETCRKLLDLLNKKQNPSFIDIGSNIGLISLYMLKNKPDIKIYAFDPGPHQTMLFRKTIEKNKLNEKIKLFEIALSNKTSEAIFCVHSSKHVSGDGFVDTGLAGEYQIINVKTKKLDDWWAENQKPKIDLLKIDTEGAELFVLEGARDLLLNCKPNIYFEMHPSLYKIYDYNQYDILNYFKSVSYKMYTVDGDLVSEENINFVLREFKDFANYYAISI